jgi:Flp pilus assembly protein TadG
MRPLSTTDVARRLRAFSQARAGTAAVEFALFMPLFGLLVAGVVDLGGALWIKFKLDSAVTAGANYAQLNASNVGSTNGQALANSIATIVESSEGSSWANDTVTVNNGPATTVSSGSSTTSGTASNADACYCPTGTATSVTWGGSSTCASSCTGGGYAGKFVVITATQTYTPIFSSYGIVQNDTITASSMVQLQ